MCPTVRAHCDDSVSIISEGVEHSGWRGLGPGWLTAGMIETCDAHLCLFRDAHSKKVNIKRQAILLPMSSDKTSTCRKTTLAGATGKIKPTVDKIDSKDEGLHYNQ